METSLRKLEEAKNVFGELEQLSVNKGLFPVPEACNRHFEITAYATAELLSLGKEKLLEMEKQRKIHPSTISGGSLDVTSSVLRQYYLHEQRSFDNNQYEQLARTCLSLLLICTKRSY